MIAVSSKNVSTTVVLFTLLTVLVFSCAVVGPEKNWDNPFDPQGTNYFPPKVQPYNDTTVSINKHLQITLQATDQNGTIAGYIWSFNCGKNWDTIMSSTPYVKSWGISDTGFNPVWYRAVDNHGLVSNIDSFKVYVSFFAPVLTPVKDSSVSQHADVAIHFKASDTNGTIVKYYLKNLLISDKWSDSSATPAVTFSKKEGGLLDIVWGAMDNDGIIVCDTFLLIFNRGPDSAGLSSVPLHFSSFDYDDYNGNLNLFFGASDPDGSRDTLTYTISLGKTGTDAVCVYSGKNPMHSAGPLNPEVSYSWILQVKDIFGDSIQRSGTFTTPLPPANPRGMKFIRSKRLRYNMGQIGFAAYEQPVHEVSFSYHFWMDSVEVTNREFNMALALTDTNSTDNNLPITGINWYDAVLYCNARSKSEQRDTAYSYTGITGVAGRQCTLNGLSVDLAASGYRLPTEAEWEYACRAGTGTQYYWGNNLSELNDYAWVKVSSAGMVHPGAQKKPNNFGLYDMSGNVWEWCCDWFDTEYYSKSTTENPSGPQTGQERLLRGGSFEHSEYFAQSGSRSKLQPQISDNTIGFRAILIVK